MLLPTSNLPFTKPGSTQDEDVAALRRVAVAACNALKSGFPFIDPSLPTPSALPLGLLRDGAASYTNLGPLGLAAGVEVAGGGGGEVAGEGGQQIWAP